MTITIELTTDQEARLESEAHQHGMTPEEYALVLLQHSLITLPKTPQELHRFWQEQGILGMWSDRSEDAPELAQKWRNEANAS